MTAGRIRSTSQTCSPQSALRRPAETGHQQLYLPAPWAKYVETESTTLLTDISLFWEFGERTTEVTARERGQNTLFISIHALNDI